MINNNWWMDIGIILIVLGAVISLIFFVFFNGLAIAETGQKINYDKICHCKEK